LGVHRLTALSRPSRRKASVDDRIVVTVTGVACGRLATAADCIGERSRATSAVPAVTSASCCWGVALRTTIRGKAGGSPDQCVLASSVSSPRADTPART
jgi:hypothetical protein